MKRKRDELTNEAHDQTTAAEAIGQTHQAAAVATREPGDEPVYPPSPNPFGSKHDNVAGVELSSYSNKDTGTYEAWIKFKDGKPSEAVRSFMKQNRLQWRGDVPKGGIFDVAGAWTLPIGYNTRQQDRLHAERIFTKVAEMILEEKGLAREPEAERF